MQIYSRLLNKAINSIVQAKEVNELDCFLNGEKTDLFILPKAQPDDFQLLNFIVIK